MNKYLLYFLQDYIDKGYTVEEKPLRIISPDGDVVYTEKPKLNL